MNRQASGNISMDVLHSSQAHDSETEANDMLDSQLENSMGRFIFQVAMPITWNPAYEHMMQVQLEVLARRARALKQQWERNGCSLILDRWNSQCGQNFISILVHCSEGMLFARSIDVSTIIDDVDELVPMICGVVDEIGVNNIVQIITNDASPHMQFAEAAVLKKHDSFSFTRCADYCINLLLGKIAALDHVSRVLLKARQITSFIYSHALPVELKDYIPGGRIISNSNLKYVAMFITLERLVSQRENLVKMVSSPGWTSSALASTSLSMQICEIIQSDHSFWFAAAKVLKLTGPIISVLLKLEACDWSMGVLYDAMDNAKEEIKQNLGLEHVDYWKMIDRIWDNYLHSSIHACGYLLNPKMFYSDRFHHDEEVSSGIRTCMIRYVRSQSDVLTVANQLDLYENKLGLFGSDTAAREAMELPQGAWWSRHGAATEMLQFFAKRILSQTCFGVSRYNMDNRLSERLHTEARSYGDQELFGKLEYIQYNLRLMDSKPLLDGPDNRLGTKKLGDWISSRAQHCGGCCA